MVAGNFGCEHLGNFGGGGGDRFLKVVMVLEDGRESEWKRDNCFSSY